MEGCGSSLNAHSTKLFFPSSSFFFLPSFLPSFLPFFLYFWRTIFIPLVYKCDRNAIARGDCKNFISEKSRTGKKKSPVDDERVMKTNWESKNFRSIYQKKKKKEGEKPPSNVVHGKSNFCFENTSLFLPRQGVSRVSLSLSLSLQPWKRVPALVRKRVSSAHGGFHFFFFALTNGTPTLPRVTHRKRNVTLPSVSVRRLRKRRFIRARGVLVVKCLN